jgi:cobalt/nickel transport system permease protein
MFASLTAGGGAGDRLWQRLDPRTRMFGVFSLVTAIALTPIRDYRKFLAYAFLILLLGIISRVPLKTYLLRSLFLLPLLVFLAASLLVIPDRQWSQRLVVIYNLVVKTILIFCGMGILVLTVRFDHIIKGLEAMKLPRILTLMLSFAHRYVFLFRQEAGRVMRARKARSFGRRRSWKEQKAAIHIIPFFIFRVLERSQRIYAAMLSRGYRDDQPVSTTAAGFRLKGEDYLYGVFFLLLLLPVVFWV